MSCDVLKNLGAPLRLIGPGLVVAAAGIGAGDVVTATVTGAEYGVGLAWALIVCVVLKFTINESLVRVQLATGKTFLTNCRERLPRFVRYLLLTYLVIWTFFVGASLANACGIAGHSIVPQVPVGIWGIIHSLTAVLLILKYDYDRFELGMKFLVGTMVLLVAFCAIWTKPEPSEIVRAALLPTMPKGSARAVLTIIGGIGGSMTLICYGYWVREKGWSSLDFASRIRVDLGIAYVVTFVFALTLSIVASDCEPTSVKGPKIASEVAMMLENSLGPVVRWAFLLGFWCAVSSAMLGVWHGVPYMFADLLCGANASDVAGNNLKRKKVYLLSLIFLAIPSNVLLLVNQPVQVVLLFTIIGAIAVPLLSSLLLYFAITSKKDAAFAIGPIRFIVLVIAVVLFAFVALAELNVVSFS